MSKSDTSNRPRSPIALPTGHFMSFAPPEVWARMLAVAGWWTKPRYWFRIAFAFLGCAFGFVLTLPERLLMAPILRFKFGGAEATFNHPPGVVIVLGYYRSGTTHLHNLLSCDRRFVTPRWRHCVAPQGFWVSWSLLRMMLIPFLGNTRPHDDVPFGPDWPGEDDFATCNWVGASSLPGRFITPKQRAYWARYHNLTDLRPRELRRWRFAEAAFLWKLTRADPSKPILLKSPSHTGRIDAFVRLLGAERVRFVHIARDPAAVLRSNIAMHQRLEPTYTIQDPPSEAETKADLTDELVESIDRFCAQSDTTDARVSRVRYQDLVADPLGELDRVYDELDVERTDEARAATARYLRAVGTYTARSSPEPDADEDPRFEGIREALDLKRPAIATAPLPETSAPDERTRKRGWWVLVATALAIAAAWIGLAWATEDRRDMLIWPAGLIIGLATVRGARVGTTSLGITAAVVTLALFAAVLYPATYLGYSHDWNRPAYDSWVAVQNSVLFRFGPHWMFLALGMGAAFRCASRKHLHPPGWTR